MKRPWTPRRRKTLAGTLRAPSVQPTAAPEERWRSRTGNPPMLARDTVLSVPDAPRCDTCGYFAKTISVFAETTGLCGNPRGEWAQLALFARHVCDDFDAEARALPVIKQQAVFDRSCGTCVGFIPLQEHAGIGICSRVESASDGRATLSVTGCNAWSAAPH